ncbi:hypothetical protein SAMN05421858_3681 [Haladaptatus litoreus]|uniref:Uncharacterized protein n=1 Tax=Haladaptatus litoreus TaxID=553468 RepID=A0A1N7DK27_9EURY|nr:hypothetical protein SAMN05421858_3681 [Haladaptatus litoreus]
MRRVNSDTQISVVSSACCITLTYHFKDYENSTNTLFIFSYIAIQ